MTQILLSLLRNSFAFAQQIPLVFTRLFAELMALVIQRRPQQFRRSRDSFARKIDAARRLFLREAAGAVPEALLGRFDSFLALFRRETPFGVDFTDFFARAAENFAFFAEAVSLFAFFAKSAVIFAFLPRSSRFFAKSGDLAFIFVFVSSLGKSGKAWCKTYRDTRNA